MGTGSPGRSSGNLLGEELMGEELIPLHLHDLVDICGVECFLLSIGVKRLRAVYGAVEQEASRGCRTFRM